MKTLIIRLDKLGDFYITLPYISAIKRTLGKENIDIIISENIFDHFKEKNYLFNKIYSYPKNGIFKKLFLIYNLRLTKYQNIIVFDGKDKSLILSFFLRALKKIIVLEKKKINFFLKMLTLNKKKYHIKINNLIDSYHILFTDVLSVINIKFINSDFNFLKHESLNTLDSIKSITNGLKNYTIIHLDEKWFSNLYIKNYEDIKLTQENFLQFIKKIISIKKTNLIITTGIIYTKFLDDFTKLNLTKIENDLFHFDCDGYKLFFIKKTNIKELEILTMNSNNLVTCNGPLTQIASSFGVNIVDIVEENLENWYSRHISNKKFYNSLFRKDFNKLSNEILLKIK